MDHAVAARLLSLNREFYSRFAPAFNASRSISDPALTCILPYVPSRARVLDVGCGNGRLALLLDDERPGATYVGVDSSTELIALARESTRNLSSLSARFAIGDVTKLGWAAEASIAAGHDCVIALAVLHHIPGAERRSRLLSDLAALARPSGRIILSTWQFLDSERLRRRIVPWREAGLSDDQVDSGDYLLDWRRGGRGLRYCHLVDEAEVRELASAAKLSVAQVTRAGGREGTLSLVVVFEPQDSGEARPEQTLDTPG